MHKIVYVITNMDGEKNPKPKKPETKMKDENEIKHERKGALM